MEKLVESIKEFLEVEDLNLDLSFTELNGWDSLSVLSILALIDSDYGINMTQKEIENFPSVAEFVKHVEANAKKNVCTD